MLGSADHVSAPRERGRRLGLTPPEVLQAVVLGGIFLLGFFQPTDADFWWHLATGRYIAETGTIPQVDPFSHTAAGNQWIVNEWLGAAIIYALYHLGGFVGAVIFFGGVTTLGFWLILRTLALMGIGPPLASVLVFWAAAISRTGWTIRPQVFSYLFTALYLYILVRSRGCRDRWLWALPAVMLVWVNVHPSHVMGLLLLGLFVVGEALNGLRALGTSHQSSLVSHQSSVNREPRTENGTQHSAPCSSLIAHHSSLLRFSIARYLAVGVATAAATLANPYGLGAPLHPLTYMGSRDFNLRFIAEWQSPDFHDPYFFIFGASLLLPMVLSFRRPTDWALALPQVVLAAMSLQWVRTLPFYAVVFAPYLATRLAGDPVPEAHRPAPRRRRLNVLLLMTCYAVLASTLFVSDRAQIGREPLGEDFPVEGVQYIERAGLTGNLFNTYHWGGFILWSFYPEKRVFVDGRTDMYGPEIVEEYREVVTLGPRWREVLERYGVRVVLVEKGSALASLLRATGEWREEFTGPVERVLVRKQ